MCRLAHSGFTWVTLYPTGPFPLPPSGVEGQMTRNRWAPIYRHEQNFAGSETELVTPLIILWSLNLPPFPTPPMPTCD